MKSTRFAKRGSQHDRPHQHLLRQGVLREVPCRPQPHGRGVAQSDVLLRGLQVNWRSTLKRGTLFPLPKGQPYSLRYPGQPVCRTCRKGYGSMVDGLCTHCRGCTAWALVNR